MISNPCAFVPLLCLCVRFLHFLSHVDVGFLTLKLSFLDAFRGGFCYIKYCLRLCLCALRKKGYISISKCATVHFANDQNRGAVAATEASTPGVYVYHYIHMRIYIYWIHVYTYIYIYMYRVLQLEGICVYSGACHLKKKNLFFWFSGVCHLKRVITDV